MTLQSNIDTSSIIIYWASLQALSCFSFNFPTLFPSAVSIGMETAECTVVPPILTAALPVVAVTINSFSQLLRLNHTRMASINVLFPFLLRQTPPSAIGDLVGDNVRGLGCK